MLREAGAKASSLSRGLGVCGYKCLPWQLPGAPAVPAQTFQDSSPSSTRTLLLRGRETERMDWVDAREAETRGEHWSSPALGYLGSEAHWRPVDRAQRHGRGRLETGHSSWATAGPQAHGNCTWSTRRRALQPRVPAQAVPTRGGAGRPRGGAERWASLPAPGPLQA